MTVKCQFIEPSVLDAEQISGRVNELDALPELIHYADPRCGCAAPDDICEWDDVRLLEDLL